MVTPQKVYWELCTVDTLFQPSGRFTVNLIHLLLQGLVRFGEDGLHPS